MMKLLPYKSYLIGAALIIAILAVVYFKGRKDGKACSWLDKLTGNCPGQKNENEPVVYVPTGPGAQWKPQAITNQIYNALDGHSWLTPNGEAINNAFFAFNNLNDQQKFDVINDWEARYKGTDRPYWGTGDYGSLRQTIEEFENDFQPQVEIAYTWMNNNLIN